MVAVSYNILTYGRLGEEFEDYLNGIPGFNCRYVEMDNLEAEIKKYDYIAGLAIPRKINISHIKWIHAFSAGVDAWTSRIDLNPDVFITKTRGRMGIKMGEYCLAYLLYFLKAIPDNRLNQDNKRWLPIKQQNLFDLNVLVLSTGGVGSGIASVMKPLVKKITGVNTSGRVLKDFSDIVQFDRLPENLSQYQVLINALPLTKASMGIINKNFFRKLHKCIYFNVGRGETTNTEDLLEALRRGNITKAVLDVFKKEPLPENSELWSHPDIIITPHQSAITDIEDVKSSFLPAFEAFSQKINNEYVVKTSRGY